MGTRLVESKIPPHHLTHVARIRLMQISNLKKEDSYKDERIRDTMYRKSERHE